MRDLIIIGAGPAGCSAGIYATRKKLNTLLITKDFTGQVGLSSWFENYPGFKRISGIELMKNFQNHLRDFEIDINSFEEVLKIKKLKDFFLVTTDEGEYKTKAIIVSTGGEPKKLGVKNEEKFIGKGISYCLTCDERNFGNKVVAVVGGGNAGVEAASELTRFAKKIYLLEFLENLTADRVLIDEIEKEEKIEIITSVDIKSFEGDGNLKEIIYLDTEKKRNKTLSVDGCFVEVGVLPETGFLNDFLDLNEKNEVIVNPRTFETSVKGVFAAGDIVDFQDKQVVLSAGQGALAALSVFRYLKERNLGDVVS